jgi:hypothetical protein
MFILYSLSWACIKLSLLSSWDLRDTVSPFHAFVPSHSTWYLGLDRCNPKWRASQVGPISSGEKKNRVSTWVFPLVSYLPPIPAIFSTPKRIMRTLTTSRSFDHRIITVRGYLSRPCTYSSSCNDITSTWWRVTPDLRTPLPALVFPSSGSSSPPIVIPSQLEAIFRALVPLYL